MPVDLLGIFCYFGNMNTIQKGRVRYIVFKEKGIWYAVALEFNIVESADDPRIALVSLLDAMGGYMESQRKIKGSRLYPLNQITDPEYEKLWSALDNNKKIPSPFQVETFGITRV
ncbi:MAG: hypothetical protein COV09_00850 [Candidatus Vogelbacteria bacterium CG10_big_fil_rev_8_21_14_0_10_50_13]|uniref:Uncharacterized protein n=1 Tax=Candidatus Vogelbacteria bacterium CG10_big_fil_rev_8_21_14_0_10_50_13 TaxID=1975044 RepID=A0A2H0RG90_9BACT|nr:MAG: hypothetical protein COV09_00850 [Candidatus Vogelbacteria bacterium CG10_big_fil_rev_8_21_14_0_10_50_13]